MGNVAGGGQRTGKTFLRTLEHVLRGKDPWGPEQTRREKDIKSIKQGPGRVHVI